ncbi:MAG: ester cyclase [Acidobacteria bacterium]|jgi:steroid delta-isomerase-like uncharacterized protein|nr:MAG: ester cyclase [Acidobacteriota bacterium]PYV87968.1 MAG: ester cyclase [Acidobacteriota bacterium]
MSVEDNVRLARRWFQEVWNEGRMQTVYELFAENGIATGQSEQGEMLRGPKEFAIFVERIRGAFPDIKVMVDDAFGADDRVALRWSATMTHKGDQLGMAATNREVKISGITITRIRNGQIVEGWDNWDRLGLMRQIGPAESSQAA